ncbi:MAG: dihydroorotate dehydrogenase [Phycisphaerales bacterium]|nr:dihydroorotate dehydrogenase [Phycisphaerales bacterium]
MSSMELTIAGVSLRSPLVAAAGAAGSGPEILQAVPAGTFGAVTTKSITPEPREGHPPWRVLEVRGGMLNAVGLANPGLDVFMSDVVPELEAVQDSGVTFIGSIAGHTIDDYVSMASAFDGVESIPLVEANLSCPNTHTGRQFTDDPLAMKEVVSAIRESLPSTPLLVKLPLEMAPGFPVAMAAREAGADGLTMVNTVPAMGIDVDSRRPRLSNRAGGLSGPAIHHLAVRMIAGVRAELGKDDNTAIIGLGGVMRWQDAAELILAGASAIGMATALYVDPRLAVRVGRGLSKWVRRQGVASLSELTGAMSNDPIQPC